MVIPLLIRKHFLLCFSIAVITIATFIALSSTVFQTEYYELPNPPRLEGILAVNDILTKADYLLEHKILGPESIIVDKDGIKTGTQDGMVVLIKDGSIQKISRFGMVNSDICDGQFDTEAQCGRPLGLRELNAATVLAVDTYLGVFSISFEKGQHEMILKGQEEVDGKPMKFLNDIEVVNDDVLLITDSSTRWDRRHLINIVLEGIPNGRVLRLTRSTGKIDVIMDRLYFANGIQLFPDKQSFLVAETTAARIKRHWIAGPRTGETEIFIDNLPGLPDNIRPGSNGTFWVALSSVRHSNELSMVDYLADKPSIRKCILQLVPERYWDWLTTVFTPEYGMILQLNEKGQIIANAQDPMGKVIKEVSQVTEADEYLYLGSFRAPYIARLHKNLIVY